MAFRTLEIHGGRADAQSEMGSWSLTIPSVESKSVYVDAQIDDYGGLKRKGYKWMPVENRLVELDLMARFSHTQQELIGTAGFGFWNAPFGDPTVPYPALPQAVWFFFGSPPNDLPLNPAGKGEGLFAGTLDATTWEALAWAPLAPVVVGLNHIPAFRKSVWPHIQSRLGISYVDLGSIPIDEWHRYQLLWGIDGCRFLIDEMPVLETTQSPRGPLGFVCWIDNQFMRVTPTGRMGMGTLPFRFEQKLEVQNLNLKLVEKNV